MNTRGLKSQLKDSVPVGELAPHAGPYGVHDTLRHGWAPEGWRRCDSIVESYEVLCPRRFSSVKSELLPSHPLEVLENGFQLNQNKMNFTTLRNIQGLHAPLKLQMEYKAVKQVQRLPFLISSNIALETLQGNDECIGFEDILNDPTQSEVMGEPHLMMEYQLGLL